MPLSLTKPSSRQLTPPSHSVNNQIILLVCSDERNEKKKIVTWNAQAFH